MKKKKSKLLKLGMKILMLPVNLMAAAFSLLVIAGIRGIVAGRKLHIKLEALERGSYKKKRR
jgi:hypothetical protein